MRPSRRARTSMSSTGSTVPLVATCTRSGRAARRDRLHLAARAARAPHRQEPERRGQAGARAGAGPVASAWLPPGRRSRRGFGLLADQRGRQRAGLALEVGPQQRCGRSTASMAARLARSASARAASASDSAAALALQGQVGEAPPLCRRGGRAARRAAAAAASTRAAAPARAGGSAWSRASLRSAGGPPRARCSRPRSHCEVLKPSNTGTCRSTPIATSLSKASNRLVP